jgi:signal transduction histidine kinase
MNKILKYFVTFIDWFINRDIHKLAEQNSIQYISTFYHSRLIICGLLFAGLFIIPNSIYEYIDNSPSFVVDFWSLLVPLIVFFASMRFIRSLDGLIAVGSVLFSIAIVHGVYLNGSIYSISSIWGSVIVMYATILVSLRWGLIASLLLCASLAFTLYFRTVTRSVQIPEQGVFFILEFAMANLISLGIIIADHSVGDSYRKKLDLLNEKNVSGKISSEASRSLTSLGKMGAGISHQINNPLAIISSLSDRIVHDFHENRLTPELLSSNTSRVLSALSRVEQIVHSLKKFTEFIPNERHFTYFDFATLVQLAMKDIQPSNRFPTVQEEVTLAKGTDFYTFCEPTMMRKAIYCLLENAFEEASLEDAGIVKVSLFKVDGSIHFSVKNSGVRILESDYSQFVQPFFTTKSSVTSNHAGMGLTIADCIIHIHGATLSIDPDEVDTTFCFSLKTLTNA